MPRFLTPATDVCMEVTSNLGGRDDRPYAWLVDRLKSRSAGGVGRSIQEPLTVTITYGRLPVAGFCMKARCHRAGSQARNIPGLAVGENSTFRGKSVGVTVRVLSVNCHQPTPTQPKGDPCNILTLLEVVGES